VSVIQIKSCAKNKIKELIEEGLSLRKISSIIGFNKESIRKIKIKLEKGEI